MTLTPEQEALMETAARLCGTLAADLGCEQIGLFGMANGFMRFNAFRDSGPPMAPTLFYAKSTAQELIAKLSRRPSQPTTQQAVDRLST